MVKQWGSGESSGNFRGFLIMKNYQLTCQCGEICHVRAGQAGGEILCPGCGNRLEIPKFGELSKLPVVEDGGIRTQIVWSTSKGLILLGAGFFLVFVAAGIWLRLPTQSPVQVAAIRKQMNRKTNVEVYDVWKNHFSKTTVARPQWAVEKQFAQQMSLKRGASSVLLLLSGVAVVLLTVGVFRLFCLRR
jgi:hypothetical protein